MNEICFRKKANNKTKNIGVSNAIIKNQNYEGNNISLKNQKSPDHNNKYVHDYYRE